MAVNGPLDMSLPISIMSDRAYQNWGTSKDQLEEAKKAYAKSSAIADTTTQGALDTSKAFTDMATGDRQFWEGTYKPAMQQQMDFARNYTTPERMMSNRAAAGATVGRTMQAGMDAAMRDLASHNIDPSSGAYVGLKEGLALQKAAAQAGAMTKSDRDTEMLGQQYLGNAINTGAALPGQSVNEAGLAMAQGNTALNASLAPANSYFNWSGTAPAWSQLGNQSQEIVNKSFVDQTQAGQRANELAEQTAARKAKESSGTGAAIGAGLQGLGMLSQMIPGWGTAAGMGLSMAGGMMGGSGMTFAEGGMVPEDDEFEWEDEPGEDMSAMGPEMGGQPGLTPEVGASVPPSASPSGGMNTDDVTAQVNVGEFIIPKDVTQWLGEKFFQKLIEKSRAELQGPQTAEPQEAPPQAMAMSPTFRSSEGAGMGA